MDTFQYAAARLSKIDWRSYGRSNRRSDCVLVNEYLRRAAQFAQVTSIETARPFFDAAKAIGREDAVPSEAIDELRGSIGRSANVFAWRICELYLSWCALVDSEEPTAIRFHDLFEPLILLFERGGELGFHHGELLVGRFTVPFHNWREMAALQPYDISEKALEFVDQRPLG